MLALLLAFSVGFSVGFPVGAPVDGASTPGASPFASPWDIELPPAQRAAVQRAAEASLSFPGGSGFFISASGFALTNHHVAEQVGDRVTALIAPRPGAEPEPISLVKVFSDPAWDLALYKGLAERQLPWIPLCDGGSVEVGQPIAVVGHLDEPRVLVSFGEVLAPSSRPDGRPAMEYRAALRWGSSGSAVIDEAGVAVAMHRAWDQDRVSAGAGVGVPLCEAVDALPALREAAGEGTKQRP